MHVYSPIFQKKNPGAASQTPATRALPANLRQTRDFAPGPCWRLRPQTPAWQLAHPAVLGASHILVQIIGSP